MLNAADIRQRNTVMADTEEANLYRRLPQLFGNVIFLAAKFDRSIQRTSRAKVSSPSAPISASFPVPVRHSVDSGWLRSSSLSCYQLNSGALLEGTDGRQRVVAHRVKVETGNGVVFHDGAAIEQQRL